MKLAYLAFDKTALRTHSELAPYFSGIDTYLLNMQVEARDLDIFNLPIMTSHVFIPRDVGLQTIQHKLILKKIKSEYFFLKQNIFSGFKFSSEEPVIVSHSEKQLYNLSDIAAIIFNKVSKKYNIQTKDQNLIEYDYLIIEGHQLVSDSVQNKDQNIINKLQRQSAIILNLDFSAHYKWHKQHQYHEFIFVNNTEIRTVFDNWYFCRVSHDKVSVSLYIPFELHESEDFLNFVTARTHKLFSQTLEPFNISSISEGLVCRSFSASDGFVIKNMTLRHAKNSAVFPSFSFWPQHKINDYIQNAFVIKNKKNSYLFREKEIS